MFLRWLRWKSLIWWAVLLGTGLCVGWWVDREQSYDPLKGRFPLELSIWHVGANETKSITIRDPQVFSLLDTLFPGYRQEVLGQRPMIPVSEQYVLEFMLQRTGSSNRIVVTVVDGVEYWDGGRGRHEVQGSLRRLLDWLPVRRSIEMRLSTTGTLPPPSPELEAEQMRVLIDNARHQVQYARVFALIDLSTLMSFSTPHTQHKSAGYPVFNQVDGFVCGHFPVDHPCAEDIRAVAFECFQGTSIRYASTILAQVSDDATIDELDRLLASSTSLKTTQQILTCVHECLGLPEFERKGICGNSSRAEMRKFHQEEERRTNEVKEELQARLARWKSMPKDQYLLEIVDDWRDEFLRSPDRFDFSFEDKLKRFRNLIGRGKAMLPIVESYQASCSDLTINGQLEFLRTMWTGTCDRDVVARLLSGTIDQRMIACDIIAAARDTSWQSELSELLDYAEADDIAHQESLARIPLANKAAESLVICHGVDSLSRLKQSGTQTAWYAIQHFEVPHGVGR